MNRFFALAALLPTFLSSASAVYTTDPSKLPSTTFDYIVVGGDHDRSQPAHPSLQTVSGGTAGNVVASRLSENNKYTVLVLEAGVDQTQNVNVNAPLLCVGLSPFTSIDW
jgi:hypothetical protein